MKVLWITNTIMPEMARSLGVLKNGSGGWMSSMLQQLRSNEYVRIAVASVSHKIKRPIYRKINEVEYWLLPTTKNSWEYDTLLEKHWRNICAQFHPDVVHVHGTEYPYGLAYIKACGNQHVVVSIQGLVSEIGKVYYSCISEDVVKKVETISDKILKKGTRFEKEHYLLRGEFEKEYLRTISYVIGRTEWDKSIVLGINPHLRYYTNDESLNEVFYEHQWENDNCEPHSVFVSQCASPIKGFHQLLKAMPIVLEKYPDACIFVAGGNKVYPASFKKRLSDSGYNVYLRQLIKEYNLKDKITFLGSMPADKMCETYLKSNVFVMCSAIENSSNALAEAQLLGMPTIATSAAGNPSMTQNGKLSLQYDFEDYEQLARYVISIFSGEYDPNMFAESQKEARIRHSRENNAKVLLDIYKEIVDNERR